MPPKKGIANVATNILEATRGPVREAKLQAVTGFSRDLAQMLYGGSEAVKTEEQIEQIKNQDRIMKNEIYGQRLRELGLMQGEKIEEITITPEQREEIEKLYKSHSKFEQEQREEAKNLGVTTQNTQEGEYQKRKLEEEEKARQEAEEKLRLETKIEVPPGRITGFAFKRKRTAPRMQWPAKSTESKVGRGIGG